MRNWIVILLMMIMGVLGGAVPQAQAQRGTTQHACDLPTRLNPGLLVQVADHDGAPLPVYDAGEAGADVVAALETGTPFTVLVGPVCDNDTVWWQIKAGRDETDDAFVLGWIMESHDGMYLVEPLMTSLPMIASAPTVLPDRPTIAAA